MQKGRGSRRDDMELLALLPGTLTGIAMMAALTIDVNGMGFGDDINVSICQI